MSLSLNYPTISPSLTLDFASTKQLDPRITFTRASTGTFYNGITTAKAEENLLVRSQELNDGWGVSQTTVIANTDTAPDGTTTADSLREDNTTNWHRLQQAISISSGVYTMSVFAKQKTGSRFATIGWSADGSNWVSATFNLSTGANTQTLTSVFTGVSASSVSVGNSWYRLILTATVPTAFTNGLLFVGLSATSTFTAASRGFDSYAGDGTSEILYWGAQLEQRSAVTAYTVTTTQPITNYIPVLQTAQNNVARFEHNPITGESLGLEIEEQRTNLFLRSDDFASASWGPIQTTVTSNTIVAPDGTLTGDKLVENTTTNAHFIRNNEFVSYTSGTAYTISVYAKKAERNFVVLFLPSSNFASTGRSVIFNLDTGLISSQQSGTTATITSVGNGWYRCSVTATANTTSSAISGGFVLSTDGSSVAQSYTGNGYSGIFIWGAQLEAGAFPTSYIPTVASQVTRSADAASMTGANFSSWFNNSEGTVYTEANFISVAGADKYVTDINDGTVNNRISSLWQWSGNTQLFSTVLTSGTNVAQTSNGTTVTANTNYKNAVGYRVNDFAASYNGGVALTDNSLTIPVVNRLSIGSRGDGSFVANANIKKLAYYPTRLTNAQLQALTGL